MKKFMFFALSASLLTLGTNVSSSPALADSVLDKVIKNKEIFIGTRSRQPLMLTLSLTAPGQAGLLR